jgi:hypothetical protein
MSRSRRLCASLPQSRLPPTLRQLALCCLSMLRPPFKIHCLGHSCVALTVTTCHCRRPFKPHTPKIPLLITLQICLGMSMRTDCDGTKLSLLCLAVHLYVNVNLTFLHEHHDMPWAGHRGVARTLELGARLYCWRSVHTDLNPYVRTCASYQRNKVRHQTRAGELKPLPVPEGRWESVFDRHCAWTSLDLYQTRHEATTESWYLLTGYPSLCIVCLPKSISQGKLQQGLL